MTCNVTELISRTKTRPSLRLILTFREAITCFSLGIRDARRGTPDNRIMKHLDRITGLSYCERRRALMSRLIYRQGVCGLEERDGRRNIYFP